MLAQSTSLQKGDVSMSYPLSRAQRRFQQIKKAEKVQAHRRAIEAAIIQRLEDNGHQVNMTVVRNLANREMRQ